MDGGAKWSNKFHKSWCLSCGQRSLMALVSVIYYMLLCVVPLSQSSTIDVDYPLWKVHVPEIKLCFSLFCLLWLFRSCSMFFDVLVVLLIVFIHLFWFS